MFDILWETFPFLFSPFSFSFLFFFLSWFHFLFFSFIWSTLLWKFHRFMGFLFNQNYIFLKFLPWVLREYWCERWLVIIGSNFYILYFLCMETTEKPISSRREDPTELQIVCHEKQLFFFITYILFCESTLGFRKYRRSFVVFCHQVHTIRVLKS